MNTLHKYLALAALALMPSMKALAQDVTIDLANPTQINGDHGMYSDNQITIEYVFDYNKTGAYIDGWLPDTYCMKITSSKAISVIEFDGHPHLTNSKKTTNIVSNIGTLHMHPEEVSIWEGSATSIKINGVTSSDYYLFTEARIWFVGTPYGKQYVADPTIKAANGKMTFASATPGATFTYNMQLTTDGKVHMCDGTVALDLPLVVSVHGEAQGYEPSTTTTQTIPFATLYGKQGDADADGRLSTADLQLIINTILKKNAR